MKRSASTALFWGSFPARPVRAGSLLRPHRRGYGDHVLGDRRRGERPVGRSYLFYRLERVLHLAVVGRVRGLCFRRAPSHPDRHLDRGRDLDHGSPDRRRPQFADETGRIQPTGLRANTQPADQHRLGPGHPDGSGFPSPGLGVHEQPLVVPPHRAAFVPDPAGGDVAGRDSVQHRGLLGRPDYFRIMLASFTAG